MNDTTIFKHEFRPEPLSDDIKAIEEALNIPIEKKGLWIINDFNQEYKHADCYPQIELMVPTHETNEGIKFTDKPDLNSHTTPGTVHQPTVKSSGSGHQSFFDDIEDDIDNSDYETSKDILNIATSPLVKEYTNIVESQNKNLNVEEPESNEKLQDYIYNQLTSAEYYIRLGSLYAESMNDNGYAAHQSKLRPDELMKLFTEHLGFFTGNVSFSNVENFAIDTPQYVIYVHLDRGNDFSHELRQINKHYCNGDSEPMPFYDSQNKMADIPYESWGSILYRKPVLMFGYEEVILPNKTKLVFNSFLGKYNATGIDAQGNFLLSLADSRFDFPR